MQKFLMILGKEKLYLYTRKENVYEKKYIEGSPSFDYKQNNASNDIKKLFRSLKDEYGLDSEAELEFDVIDNEDPVSTDVMMRVLGSYIAGRRKIEDVIETVMKKLVKDKNLLVDDYGVNFDGKNYVYTSGKLVKKDFNLLGYTLKADSIVKYLG